MRKQMKVEVIDIFQLHLTAVTASVASKPVVCILAIGSFLSVYRCVQLVDAAGVSDAVLSRWLERSYRWFRYHRPSICPVLCRWQTGRRAETLFRQYSLHFSKLVWDLVKPVL